MSRTRGQVQPMPSIGPPLSDTPPAGDPTPAPWRRRLRRLLKLAGVVLVLALATALVLLLLARTRRPLRPDPGTEPPGAVAATAALPWWETRHEWRIGVSANRLLAMALANGSDLRALVQTPLPRDYFSGALLDEVEPASTPVYQAWRQPDGGLVLEFDGQGKAIALRLRNVPAVARLKGLPAGAWSYATGVLTVPAAGRLRLVVTPAGLASTMETTE